MKQSNQMIFRRLLALLMMLCLLMGTGIDAVLAEGIGSNSSTTAENGTDSALRPDDLSYEDGNVILHKQATRTGPDEWTVNVKVTVGDKPVEKRKLEVVFVLDCSGSMAWCTDEAAHAAGSHTHSRSCYDKLICTEEEHTHSYDNGCAGSKCTDPTHYNNNGWHKWDTTCISRYGTYYTLDCDKKEHTHNTNCYTTSDTLQCGRDECTHSSSGATRCSYKDENGQTVYYKTRLEAAKEAISTIVSNLTQDGSDNVVFKYVIFSSAGYDNGVSKPSNKSTMAVSSFANVTAKGGTKMYHGIETGIGEFSDNEYKKVLVVLTDGEADDYPSDASSLSGFKNPNGTDGTVFTVGFAYSNATLGNIAGNGGSYVHASNADALKLAFKNLEQSLTAMLEDPMGTNVGFTSGSISEIQNTSGKISISADNKTIYWHPKADGTDTVRNSVIEYTYEVKLNGEADRTVGEHSNVPLNNPTNFLYGIKGSDQTADMKSAAFPIPKATYAYSSIQTTWKVAGGAEIPREYLTFLPADITNPTAEESIICDYTSGDYIPAYQQPYKTAPSTIAVPGSDNYYRYIGTTVTKDEETIGSVEEVDATQAVAYKVVHNYELVEANELYVDATKYMQGRDFNENDSFTFTLTAVDNAPMPEGSVNGVKTIVKDKLTSNVTNFSFGKIVYTQAGTYTYIVQELEGNQEHVVYDTTPHTLVVTVTDNNGKLSVVSTLDGQDAEIRFINKLESGSLKIEKAEVISHLAEHQNTDFKFLVSVRNQSGRPITGDYPVVFQDNTPGKVTFTNGTGSISLKAGQWAVINGLPDGATYTVTEDQLGGFTYTATGDTGTIEAHEESFASFKNSYASEGRHQFLGFKTLEGGDLESDKYTFNVELRDETGEVLATGKNNKDGSIFFDTLYYTHEDVGVKTYQLYEVIGDEEGMLYDPKVYDVKLTITDNGDGTLTIKDDLGDRKIAFHNKYISNALTINKQVTGNMGNRYKDFSFTLTVPAQANDTISVSTDGGQTFEEKTLNPNGQMTFTMKHGENIIFYPINGEYTVTEEKVDGYDTTCYLNGTKTEGTSASITGTIPEGGNHMARFENRREVPPPTGIFTSDSAALAGIVMAMALLAIVYAGRRWRIIER